MATEVSSTVAAGQHMCCSVEARAAHSVACNNTGGLMWSHEAIGGSREQSVERRVR